MPLPVMEVWVVNAHRQLTSLTPDERVGLGDVLVLRETDALLLAIGPAVALPRSHPWAPLVICARSPTEPAVIEELGVVGGDVLVVHCPDIAMAPRIARTAVGRRRAPDVASFSSYVRSRAGAGTAENVARVLAGDVVSIGQVRRALSKLGRWSPHDWRAVYRLLRCVAQAIQQPRSLADAADHVGFDARTVRRWLRHYSPFAWDELMSLSAWEGVLEAMLRRADGERAQLARPVCPYVNGCVGNGKISADKI